MWFFLRFKVYQGNEKQIRPRLYRAWRRTEAWRLAEKRTEKERTRNEKSDEQNEKTKIKLKFIAITGK